jgi:hypothetical protein
MNTCIHKYVNIYIYMHIYIHKYIHTCICIYIHKAADTEELDEVMKESNEYMYT